MRIRFLAGLTLAFSIPGLFALTHAETITKPHTFTDGTPAMATEVNANFDTVYNQVNKVGAEIHIDSTNHRVGIGTMNPGAKLTIAGEGENIVNSTVAYGGSEGIGNDVIPVYVGLRARGSVSFPTAVQPGDIFAYFGGKGYAGSQWPEFSTAGISMVATEAYTGTNQGSKIVFFTTPNGSTSKRPSLVITPGGTLKQVNGYTQLALTNDAPPAADCDDTGDLGRMKVDATAEYLYICVATGWKVATLGSPAP